MGTYQIMLSHKIRFGVDCIDTVEDEAKELAAKQIIIITDPGVFKAGLTDRVKEQLSKAKASVHVFTEAEPEPTLPRLNAIAQELTKNKYDLLVAVGGGSCIDAAKGLSILLAHGGNGQNYIGVNKVPGPGIPVFALPTTAGTGSEVTNIAIFGDPERQLKLGMVSPYLLPELALVDPTLTYGCPRNVTAASGIDALVHAIECYTSNKANNFSDALALEAMQLITGNLRKVVKNGTDKEARNHMSEGSLIAGIAMQNSGVAAVHALAYSFGSQFRVPHGVANGLLLPYVMECNLSANLAKYAIVAQILGAKTQDLPLQEAAEKGVEVARAFVADIGIHLSLREFGVRKEDLKRMAIATMGVTRLLSNNPKQLTLHDVRRIFENAW